MRILITGAAGNLGRAVREQAKGEHDLVLFDQSEKIVADGGIRGQMTDRQAVHRAAQGCDAIIHTAAMHGAYRGKASNAQFIETNVLGTEYLFEAALKHGIKRLAIASSMEVMIGVDWGAYGTAVLDETLPPRPDWIYPVTKRQIEVLGSLYARHHGLEVVQLRYMAFGNAEAEALGLNLLARVISAEDVGQATLLAATKPGLKDEILHIGPDTPLTQRDVNEALEDPSAVLERLWPGCLPYLQKQGQVPKPDHFWPVTRIDLAKKTLGWAPRNTFETYLQSLGWKRP
jgi:nucleoside-diphosphate-sugar epimerase